MTALRRVGYFLWTLTGLWFTALFAHEAGHWLAATWLGGTASISYHPLLLGGQTPISGVAEAQIWVVYIAGGVFGALWVGVWFWLTPALTPTYHDTYWELASFPVVAGHLFRAVQEAWGGGMPMPMLALGLWSAATLAGIVYLGIKTAVWLAFVRMARGEVRLPK